MFEALSSLPPDAILGLMSAFREDPRSEKVDLGVGIYKDEGGNTPVLECVKRAERRLLEQEDTKAYIGPAGDEGYNERVGKLILSGDLSGVASDRVSVIQTPGGCGALRSAAELIVRCGDETTLWVPDPTWANHVPLLGDAGLKIRTYPYFDPRTSAVRFEEMAACLGQLGRSDVVLLHGCCHNPSGADLDRAQWDTVVELARRTGFTPFVDLAYQGFGDGLDEDAYGVRQLAASVPELIVASSCSKNFGLYRERTGAVLLLSESASQAAAVKSQLLSIIRGIYSMPPSHGAAIVAGILSDAELTTLWTDELRAMRDRINSLRSLLVARFQAKGAGSRFDFIARQRGMFSFLGVDEGQVSLLRERHGIYMVDSSRINVAGVNSSNIDYFCDAILDVL